MPPPAPPSTTPPKRSPVWVLLFLLIPAIGFGALLIKRLQLHRQAKARVAAIRAASLPISGAEIGTWLPAPPPEKNGALIMTQAFALFRDLADARSNTVSSLTNLLSTNRWSAEVREAVRAHLQTNAPALERIHEGLSFSEFRYPVAYHESWAALLPHLPKCKQAVSLLGMKAALAAEEGRTNEWPKTVAEQIGVAETLNAELLLVSQLVRQASLRLASKTAFWTLSHGPPSPEDCLRLQTAFLRAADTNLLPQTLVVERAAVLPMFQMNFKDFERFGSSNDGGELQPPMERDLTNQWGGFLGIVGLADRDKIFYMDTLERAIEHAKLGPPESLKFRHGLDNASDVAKSRYYFVTAMFLPALGKVAVRFGAGQAEARMAGIAFAVERYRHARGALPHKLADLVPEFMPQMPVDPFDGKPLRYIPTETGYRLYSIGDDEMDDGGRVAPKWKKLNDQNTYDLVFEVER
ncbi:MAG TPA: hypothetical protein VM680_01830 [Verrucomicrobiae bacterium]|nr:hypothetical protein [Verrucomicrobiae bacterium]